MAGTKNSGRKKTPTATLVKRGSYKGIARSKKEPTALPDFFIEPSKMSKMKKTFYDTYRPILEKSGILSGTDSIAFELMAEYYCRVVVLRDIMEDEDGGMFTVVTDRDGNKKPSISALMKLLRDCESDLVGMLREFGLTPASRGGIERIDHQKKSTKKLT